MAGVSRIAPSGTQRCRMSSWLSQLPHLSRRFFGALSRSAPSSSDQAWALGFLLEGEAALWKQLGNADQRHSIDVARRFSADLSESPRDEMAGALLHDIGKVSVHLGTFGRVLATIVGPRTRSFRIYHDHEQIGIELLREAGSTAATLSLLDGTTQRVDALAALRRADNV